MGIRPSKPQGQRPTPLNQQQHNTTTTTIQTETETTTHHHYGFSSSYRRRYMTQCVPLLKAALKDDWDAAHRLLQQDRTLIQAHLTNSQETALHIAAVEGYAPFVHKLSQHQQMDACDAKILNIKGCTALTFAAAAGHLEVVKTMLEEYPELINFKGTEGVTPLYMAALMGHAHVASHFFNQLDQKFLDWPEQEQIELLTTSIDSGLYGLAKSIVNKNTRLAAGVDTNNDTPLGVLARMPSAFVQTQQRQGEGEGVRGFFQSFAGKVMKLIKTTDKKMSDDCECDAYALFDCLWDGMMSGPDIETGLPYDKYTTGLVFKAAEIGNYHFLEELIRKDPSFLYSMNERNQSIIHIAILHRQAGIFNLIYEVGSGTKGLLAMRHDPEDNSNMLHLAAKLPAQNKLTDLPGAALQMQREVLWYKEVEKIVLPCYINMVNKKNETPHDLFLKEHQELMKEGEKEMKKTANSFMLVTTLITTVVFSSACTVPGGYDNTTGLPILLQNGNKLFLLFPISEAMATLSSLVSMLMFLSILTSRYEENDFLTTLPFWLVMGVMALFVSIVSMMGTFCISLLLYGHGMISVMVLVGLCGCVPLMFIALKYHLLVGVVRSTYGCRRLFRSNYNYNDNDNNRYRLFS